MKLADGIELNENGPSNLTIDVVVKYWGKSYIWWADDCIKMVNNRSGIRVEITAQQAGELIERLKLIVVEDYQISGIKIYSKG